MTIKSLWYLDSVLFKVEMEKKKRTGCEIYANIYNRLGLPWWLSQ